MVGGRTEVGGCGDQPEAPSSFLSLGAAWGMLTSEAEITVRPRAWLFPAREPTKFQNVPGRNGAPARPASRGCKTLPNESSPGEGEVTCKEAAKPQVFFRRLKIAGLPPHTPSNTVQWRMPGN